MSNKGNQYHWPAGASNGGQFAPKYRSGTIQLYEESRNQEPIRLASTKSMRTSLEAIRNGSANLNKKRAALLARVPNTGDWAATKKDSISMKDLSYLTAATGHEFALIRSKHYDFLFHGPSKIAISTICFLT